MDTCEYVVYIIFWKHDLGNSFKVLPLIFPEPKNLGRSKACKSNIGRQGRELLLADFPVEIGHLFRCSAVIPKDGRTDHIVLFIQNHKAVHLTATADADYILALILFQQFRNTFQHSLTPILGILLAPAGFGKFQGILLGHDVFNITRFVHQQQFYRGST